MNQGAGRFAKGATTAQLCRYQALCVFLLFLLGCRAAGLPPPSPASLVSRQPAAFLSGESCNATGDGRIICVLQGAVTLARGQPVALPGVLEVLGNGHVDQTREAGCTQADNTCGWDSPYSKPPYPPPSAAGTGSPGAQPVLDLSSLSGVFVVPANGSVTLRGLTIAGALLPASPYPLPAASFLAVSAFKLPARSTLSQPPVLQLTDALVITPSCSALSMHQDLACRASPSPNFTVTPSSLVVHRYTTPTASLTNVTLVCSGAPAPSPCLAASASSGAGMLSSMRLLQAQAAAMATTVSGSVAPAYLFICRHITLADASTDAVSLDQTGFVLVIAGSPDGATVLDLADRVNIVSIDFGATLQLHNLTIGNPPSGPATQRPWSLMRVFLWTFKFRRQNLGPRGTRLLVRGGVIALPPDELAYWFATVAVDVMPDELSGSLCTEGSGTLVPTGAQVSPPSSGSVALLLSVESWSSQQVIDKAVMYSPRGFRCRTDNALCAGDANAASPNTVGSQGPLVGNDSGSSEDDAGINEPLARVVEPACPPAPAPPLTPQQALNAAAIVPRCDLCATRHDCRSDGSVALDTWVRVSGPALPGVLTRYGSTSWLVMGVAQFVQPKEFWTPAPATVVAPTVLFGSYTEVTVLDLGQLPSAIQLRAPNASLIVRAVALINPPPAGLFPVLPAGPPPSPRLPPPGGSFSPAEPAVTQGSAAGSQAQGQPLRRSLRRTVGAGDIDESGDVGSHAAAGGTSRITSSHIGRHHTAWEHQLRSRRQLLEQGPSGVTQGLPAVMANFTSCLWTLDFDRAAAAGGAPGVKSSDSASGGDGRSTGLPYAFLDSVVIVVPQAELNLLASLLSVAHSDGSAATAAVAAAATRDPELAGQLATLLTGSRLAATTAAALAAASGVHVLGDGGSLPIAANPLVTTLAFDAFSWCALYGRNVTLTYEVPNVSWEEPLAIVDPHLELPHLWSTPQGPQVGSPHAIEHPAAPSVPQPPLPQPPMPTEAPPLTPAPAVPGPGLALQSPSPVSPPTLHGNMPPPSPGQAPAAPPRPFAAAPIVASPGAWSRAAIGGTATGAVAACILVVVGALFVARLRSRQRQRSGKRLAATAARSPAAPREDSPAEAGIASGGSGSITGALCLCCRKNRSGAAKAVGITRGHGRVGKKGPERGALSISVPAQAYLVSQPGQRGDADADPLHSSPGLRPEPVTRHALVVRAVGHMYSEVYNKQLYLTDDSLSATRGPQSATTSSEGRSSSRTNAPAASGYAGNSSSTISEAKCHSGCSAWANPLQKRMTTRTARLTSTADGSGSDAPCDSASTAGGSVPLLQTVTSMAGSASGEGGGLEPGVLRVVCELGRGAQGVVYRGTWRGLPVAVKSVLLQRPLQASGGTDPRVCQAINEAAISASVSHPNVVATYTYMLQRLDGGGAVSTIASTVTDMASGSGTASSAAAVTATTATASQVGSQAPDASGSLKAAAEPEVWKLTLVQELCDAGSLRACLEQGTLAACRVTKVARAGALQWSPVTHRPSGGNGSGPLGPLWSPSAFLLGGGIAAARVSGEPAPDAHDLSPEQPTQAPEAADPRRPQHPDILVVLMVALQAARGLAHLHGRAIVHADVSSANILLQSDWDASGGRPPAGSDTNEGGTKALANKPRARSSHTSGASGGTAPYRCGYVAKLCDFGLSGRLERAEQETHLSGLARRSSAYSPPELVRHGRAGPPGDVYALGVVLWEIALGMSLPSALARPEGQCVRDWLAAQSAADPWVAGALPPELLAWPERTPAGYVRLVGECLREEPADRPTAEQMRRCLDKLVADVSRGVR